MNFKEAEIIFKNLEEEISLKKHDLAISVETAEHLSPGRAHSFVRDLCNTSDVVFFSGAVDGHGDIPSDSLGYPGEVSGGEGIALALIGRC